MAPRVVDLDAWRAAHPEPASTAGIRARVGANLLKAAMPAAWKEAVGAFDAERRALRRRIEWRGLHALRQGRTLEGARLLALSRSEDLHNELPDPPDESQDWTVGDAVNALATLASAAATALASFVAEAAEASPQHPARRPVEYPPVPETRHMSDIAHGVAAPRPGPQPVAA